MVHFYYKSGGRSVSELPAVATLTVTSGHSTLSSEITLKKTTDRGGYITGVFVSANVCVIASDMAKSLYRNCVVMEIDHN